MLGLAISFYLLQGISRSSFLASSKQVDLLRCQFIWRITVKYDLYNFVELDTMLIESSATFWPIIVSQH